MHTACTFTICRNLLPRGCTCLFQGGVPAWSWGVYLPGPGGCTCLFPGGCTFLVRGRGRGCTCLVLGGCTCLGWGGVPAWSGGVYLPGPRGCTCLVWGGVPAPGPGGVCTWSGGCVPAWSWGVYLVRYPPPLWTEWQTDVKILPCPKLRLRAVMMHLRVSTGKFTGESYKLSLKSDKHKPRWKVPVHVQKESKGQEIWIWY